MSDFKLPISVAELKKRLEMCKGVELKMNFGRRDGITVPAYVAQVDFEIGITLRGPHPYLGRSTRSTDKDVDLRCVTRKNSVRRGGHAEYHRALYTTLLGIESGVYIVSHDPGRGNMTSCGF